MSERIPLAVPTLAGNEAAYLQACIDTNFVSSVGPFVERFESTFAGIVGSRYAVACATGTAAIHVALRVLGIGAGDEVFVPTLTFIASANPIAYQGASPVLLDVEASTMNLDPGIVADELARRARTGARQPAAIEVVHLLGHPADLGPLLEAADRYGVPIVEDASEALGATYRGGPLDGRQVGSVGRLGCFSFNGNKLVTTGGGGMITTDDPVLAAAARHLTTQARLPGRRYQHDAVGYNYRLTNLAAAVGLAQLERLDALLEGRRANAAHYDRALPAIDGIDIAPRAPWAAPTFWLYSALLDRPVVDVVAEGLDARGVEARPIWTPLHRTPVYADAPRLGGAVAEDLADRAISLPSSSSLTEADRERVVDALRAVVPVA